MAIINRIALLILTIVSAPILLILSLISPKLFAIYLAYLTENVLKYLYEK